MNSRTHDEVFQEWLATRPSTTWREHIAVETALLLRGYIAKGFYVIPLAEKSKRPIARFKWSKEEASYDFLFYHLSQHGNIGVVAGLSKPKMVILDYDGELPTELEPILQRTPSSRSPGGYHFFLKGKYNQKFFQMLKEQYPGFDVVREGIGYVVVPPSMTCIEDHNPHLCSTHDWRMHEWIGDMEKPLKNFNEFVKEICRTKFYKDRMF